MSYLYSISVNYRRTYGHGAITVEKSADSESRRRSRESSSIDQVDTSVCSSTPRADRSGVQVQSIVNSFSGLWIRSDQHKVS